MRVVEMNTARGGHSRCIPLAAEIMGSAARTHRLVRHRCNQCPCGFSLITSALQRIIAEEYFILIVLTDFINVKINKNIKKAVLYFGLSVSGFSLQWAWFYPWQGNLIFLADTVSLVKIFFHVGTIAAHCIDWSKFISHPGPVK